MAVQSEAFVFVKRELRREKDSLGGVLWYFSWSPTGTGANKSNTIFSQRPVLSTLQLLVQNTKTRVYLLTKEAVKARDIHTFVHSLTFLGSL
eukprot:g44606.t1